MKYSADAECEIIHCVNCEISHSVRCEMKFALHICEANISQRSYFTWALPNFTRRRRISLKKAHLRCRCAFFWRRHPEVRPPLRSGGGSEPDSDQVRAVKFVRSAQKRARHPEFRAWREYIHALPLTSKLDALYGGICEPDPAMPTAYSAEALRASTSKTKSTSCEVLFVLEAPPGIGPGIEVLQTFALPLGYGAVQLGTGSISLFRILFKSCAVRHCF